MALFELKDFLSHSGQMLHWKIECDALDDEDWKCLAFMIAERQRFAAVVGVPRGGSQLAEKLQQYCDPQAVVTLLIVDDVLTTGNSMEAMRKAASAAYNDIEGFVVFARGPCPDWVRALFQMQP